MVTVRSADMIEVLLGALLVVLPGGLLFAWLYMRSVKKRVAAEEEAAALGEQVGDLGPSARARSCGPGRRVLEAVAAGTVEGRRLVVDDEQWALLDGDG